jgi:hypothetical protein
MRKETNGGIALSDAFQIGVRKLISQIWHLAVVAKHNFLCRVIS